MVSDFSGTTVLGNCFRTIRSWLVFIFHQHIFAEIYVRCTGYAYRYHWFGSNNSMDCDFSVHSYTVANCNASNEQQILDTAIDANSLYDPWYGRRYLSAILTRNIFIFFYI